MGRTFRLQLSLRAPVIVLFVHHQVDHNSLFLFPFPQVHANDRYKGRSLTNIRSLPSVRISPSIFFILVMAIPAASGRSSTLRFSTITLTQPALMAGANAARAMSSSRCSGELKVSFSTCAVMAFISVP